MNPIVKYSSCIGNKPYYHYSTLKSAKILTENWKIFRDEALATYKSYSTIKGDHFFNDIVQNKKDWKKLYIKWHSDIDPIAKQKCPKSCKIIKSLPDVTVAMFSVLSPGTHILPHKGLYKGCLRFHLGLDTPNSEDCFIVVDNKRYVWKNGESVLFDDTYEHWVKNNTNKTRIILFCDIVRPMKSFGKNLNNLYMKKLGFLTSRNN